MLVLLGFSFKNNSFFIIIEIYNNYLKIASMIKTLAQDKKKKKKKKIRTLYETLLPTTPNFF